MIKMGGSIPQPLLLLWFIPLPPKAKHPKAKGKEIFKKKRKTKEKYKEKIKPENFQHQPLFPQHFVCGSPFLPALSKRERRQENDLNGGVHPPATVIVVPPQNTLKQNTLKPKRKPKRKLSQRISNINHCSHNTCWWVSFSPSPEQTREKVGK